MSESSRRAPAGRVAFVHPPADAGAVGMMAMAARLHIRATGRRQHHPRATGHRHDAPVKRQARSRAALWPAVLGALQEIHAQRGNFVPLRPVEALDGLVQLGQGEEVVDRVGSTGEAQGTQSVPRMFASGKFFPIHTASITSHTCEAAPSFFLPPHGHPRGLIWSRYAPFHPDNHGGSKPQIGGVAVAASMPFRKQAVTPGCIPGSLYLSRTSGQN
eukprot:scaffold9352_cov119-Isochrysis_galbana.AAC.2